MTSKWSQLCCTDDTHVQGQNSKWQRILNTIQATVPKFQYPSWGKVWHSFWKQIAASCFCLYLPFQKVCSSWHRDEKTSELVTRGGWSRFRLRPVESYRVLLCTVGAVQLCSLYLSANNRDLDKPSCPSPWQGSKLSPPTRMHSPSSSKKQKVRFKGSS